MADITIQDLIEKGLMSPQADLYKVKTGEKLGKLNKDGTIRVESNGIVKNYEYPSGAARWVEKLSINGWIYWGVKIKGSIVPLSDLRLQLK